MSESRLTYFFKTVLQLSLALLICAIFTAQALAQDEFGDNAADPVKLFERAQGAHARGEFEKALDLYEQAIKVRPEFPEAEFQRGNALVSLGRFDEAEAAFKRASALKKNWSLPYSALGALLMRREHDAEATQTFRQALAIDPKDNVALRLLSEIRLHAGDPKEALELAKFATQSLDAPTSSWIGLAIAERANGNKEGAKTILNRVITDEPNNLAALLERADLFTDQKEYEPAIADLQAAAKLRPDDKIVMARLAFVYQQAGRQPEANAVAKTAGLEIQSTTNGDKNQVIGTPEEIEAANNSDKSIARPALEKLIEKNPKSAMLLARLGATFRTEDPKRALELYRRAAELEPTVTDYAVGYAAALVQSRRFPEAAYILQQVVKREPQNYQAHANLATALYEAKQFPAAIAEFEWVLATKPDVIVAQYFIATSHDYLGEYPEALAAYEKFLATADANTNQLEIEKVKLRLPTLQRQIKLGEGVKKKP
ncbi:MAG TPA: tetratricopeptide repeat protein [Pyrinomonadaceae bacterium]